VTSTGNGDRQPLVIGYDGSEFANHAIQEAARLFPGRRAVVVNVFPSPPLSGFRKACCA
jgi:hypothetical protein